jgi:bifunctional non-homologous end joining protein LigD
MPLQTYRQKRDFKLTPEPKGAARPSHKSGLQFVIQKHDASRLHYDFRLELDGTLKSWAVPKGPSLDPARKALAVQVEDHPLEYGDFEGVIPQGQYGGGTVLVWDRGTWEPMGNPTDGYAAGKLHFILHGQKLHGEWALVRMHGRSDGDGKNWLLMKVADKYASKSRDILDDAKSVKSKRSLKQIEGDRDDVWSGQAKETSKITGAAKSAMPQTLVPQLAVLAERPPEGDQWIHEIKFDGYRLLAFIKAGKVKLLTRNGLDWTARFPDIAKALARLKVDSAIVDGEAVVLDKEGRSDFQALQAAFKGKTDATPVLYAFDLPFCDGVDLRNAPLIQRKERLEKLLKESNLAPRVNFSEHVRGSGEKLIAKACAMALEGIISKRIDSPYVSRRDPSWVKSKCGNRQEFVIIGYTDPEGSRQGFGSLLLGYHDDKNRLVYAGRVGTGFDDQQLRRLHARLAEIEQDKPPTDVPPPRRELRDAHWVTPRLVGEVRFTGWTRDGVLRHPAFIALRSDKPAAQIVREKPLQPKKVAALAAHRSNGRTPAPSKKDSTPADSADAFAGVRLTHPDKVLYPDVGVTKHDLAEYYQAVQQWMLPYVVDRPLALVRCPDGQTGKCFFQRNWNETMPRAVGKVQVGKPAKKEQHVAVADLAGVISLVQIGVLEIHTWNCRADDNDHPDQLVFDLDPGPDLPWKRVVEAVQMLNRMLVSLKLPTFLKTSGGKGLHVTIPIEPDIEWSAAKSFCQTIAQELVQKSDLFVANMRKDLRGGKVYVDYNRNDRFSTAIAPYSTRARPGAAVSMPIAWTDLPRVKSAAQFNVKNSLVYLSKRRLDPWRDFEKSRVNIRKIVQAPAAP